MRKVLIVAVFATCLLQQSCAQKPSLESVKTSYQKEILKIMKKEGVPGASIMVLSQDSILWKASFGYADQAKQVKVDEHTAFGIGSVTKVFTAVAALKAQEQSLWNLDHPLHQYLPFEPQHGDKSRLTLRSILSHHSGLAGDLFPGMFTKQPGAPAEVLTAMNAEPLSAEPGLVKAYSNPAFSLLGLALSKVSGKSFESYVQEELLGPLGMTHSHFDCQHPALSKTYDDQGQWAPDACLRDVPAGGLYSTAEDMGKWAQAMLREDPRLLNQHSYAAMFSPQNKDVALDFDNVYGLSWDLKEKPHLGPYWSHTGSTLYYNASLVVAKKAGLAIVILTNAQNGGRVYRLGSSILRDFAQARGQNIPLTPKPKLEPKTRVQLSAQQLETYTGTYAQPGLLITLQRKGNGLSTTIEGFKTRLIPVGDGVFVPKIWLWGFIPIRLGDTRFYCEKVNGYSLLTQREEGSNKEMLGVKLATQHTQGWEKLQGRYLQMQVQPDETPLVTSLEIKKENGVMLLSMDMHGNTKPVLMPLDIQSPSLARIAGLGRYAGMAVQVFEEDGVKSLKVFGMVLRREG